MYKGIEEQFNTNFIYLSTRKQYIPKKHLSLSFRKNRKNLKEYISMMKSGDISVNFSK